ncbi:ribonuclease E inhibitor RraB [Nocardia sp. NPDC005366]|uniref:ribonuclease E inhibitor RraB n=1 Tax=Nocardia sp. NPDC005366 TaxID=3156878 RepID=UPI00339FCFC6
MEADVATGLWRRLFGRKGPEPLDPSRTDLVVVASSFDHAEACSAALSRATGFDADAPAVLRHHLRIPAAHRERVCEIAAQDGYAPDQHLDASDAGALAPLILRRVQIVDALHCSQERSRMAGLAQRHDGFADGWDALQPGIAAGPRE